MLFRSQDPGAKRVDMVLGDAHGNACAPAVTDEAERILVSLGFMVARNVPYAGGYTTRHYGRPGDGVHALQVEINRALYMDERAVARSPGLPGLAATLARFVERLVRLDPRDLAKTPAGAPLLRPGASRGRTPPPSSATRARTTCRRSRPSTRTMSVTGSRASSTIRPTWAR